MSLAFGFSGIRSRGDTAEPVPESVLEAVSVDASGPAISATPSAGVLVSPGDSVLLGLILVGRTGSGVDVPRLVSRMGLVGSGRLSVFLLIGLWKQFPGSSAFLIEVGCWAQGRGRLRRRPG